MLSGLNPGESLHKGYEFFRLCAKRRRFTLVCGRFKGFSDIPVKCIIKKVTDYANDGEHDGQDCNTDPLLQ